MHFIPFSHRRPKCKRFNLIASTQRQPCLSFLAHFAGSSPQRENPRVLSFLSFCASPHAADPSAPSQLSSAIQPSPSPLLRPASLSLGTEDAEFLPNPTPPLPRRIPFLPFLMFPGQPPCSFFLASFPARLPFLRVRALSLLSIPFPLPSALPVLLWPNPLLRDSLGFWGRGCGIRLPAWEGRTS